MLLRSARTRALAPQAGARAQRRHPPSPRRDVATAAAAPAAGRAAASALASLLPWRTATLLAIAGVSALGVTLLSSRPWSRPVERAWARRVADTLAAAPPGAAEVAAALPGPLLPREADADALAAELAPATGLYVILAGRPNSGKTTLIKLALPRISAAHTAGGVALVQFSSVAAADSAADPGRALASAIGFSFEDVSRAFSRVAPMVGVGAAAAAAPDPADTLARVAAALEEGAATLKEEGAPPPLIVVDGCDALAARGGDAVAALLSLQELGAAWAARGLITLAFVVGSPDTERLLTSTPAGAAAVRVTVPPLAPSAAAAWLRGRGLRGDDATLAPITTAAGDDFGALARAARAVAAGGLSVKDAADEVAAAAEPRFAGAGALDAGPSQDAALAALAAVAARGALSPSDWRRLVPDQSARAALLAEGDGGPLTRGGGRGGQGDVSFASAADAAFVARGLLARVLADETAWTRAVASVSGVEEGGQGVARPPPTAGTDA